MKKVKVNIEEHLNREIYIDVPEDIEDPEIYAEEKAAEMYGNGELILDADDYNGINLISINDSEYYRFKPIREF